MTRLPVDDGDVQAVEPAVRDAGGVKPGDLLPQLVEQVIGHLLRRHVLERLDVGLTRDDQRVAPQPLGRDDHLGHANAGPGGHHRRERLVLDLLDAADGHALPRVAVGERAPTPREPLGVLRVAPEHPYRDRLPARVVADVLGRPDPLAFGRAKIARLKAERAKLEAYLLGRGHAGCGPEREPHERGAAQAEREAREGGRGQRRAERDCADRGEEDERDGKPADRPYELGACHDEDRGDPCDP